MNFSDRLRQVIPCDVFTKEDTWIAMPELSKQAIDSGISRSLRHEEIIKLKRGFYLFGDRLQKNPVSLFSLANRL